MQRSPAKDRQYGQVPPAKVLKYVALDALCRQLATQLVADETYTGADAGSLLENIVGEVVASLPSTYDKAVADPAATLQEAHKPRPHLRRVSSVATAAEAAAKKEAAARQPKRVSKATLARRKRMEDERRRKRQAAEKKAKQRDAAAAAKQAETDAAVEAGRRELLEQQQRLRQRQTRCGEAKQPGHKRPTSEPHLVAEEPDNDDDVNGGGARRRRAVPSKLPRMSHASLPTCRHCMLQGDAGDVYCSECGRVMVAESSAVRASTDSPGGASLHGSSGPRGAPPPSDLARRLSELMGTGTSVSNLAGALSTPQTGGSRRSTERSGRNRSRGPHGNRRPPSLDDDLAMPSLDEILDGLADETPTNGDTATTSKRGRSPSRSGGAQRRPSASRSGSGSRSRSRSRSPASTIVRGFPSSSELARALKRHSEWRELQWAVDVVGSRRCRAGSSGGVFIQFKMRCTVSWSARPYGQPRQCSAVVHRRFRDFLWLIDCLAHRCLGSVLPLLPARPKDEHDKFSKMALMRRRARLAMWLRIVTVHPVWRHAPELAAFLLADDTTFARLRTTVAGRHMASAVALPHALQESAWDAGRVVETVAGGDEASLREVPRVMGGTVALMESAVAPAGAVDAATAADALVGSVISRTTALKSMLNASASLVAAWAGQADAQSALGTALAGLSNALTLAAPDAAAHGSRNRGADTSSKRRAASAASFRAVGGDFAQAVGELSAPGRAARTAATLQQPAVDELSFWSSQVFGAAERCVVYATGSGTAPPPAVVADVAWLETKCRARAVHTCVRFAAVASSAALAERRAWLQLQRSLRDPLGLSFDPPMDLLIDTMVRDLGGPNPALARKGVCDHTPFDQRYAAAGDGGTASAAGSGVSRSVDDRGARSRARAGSAAAALGSSLPAGPTVSARRADREAAEAKWAAAVVFPSPTPLPPVPPGLPPLDEDGPSRGGGRRPNGVSNGRGAGQGTKDDGDDDEAEGEWQDGEPGIEPPLGNVYAGLLTLYTPPPPEEAPPSSPTPGDGDGYAPSPGSPASRRSVGHGAPRTPTRMPLPKSVSLALTSNATSSPGAARNAASQRARQGQATPAPATPASPDTPALMSRLQLARQVDVDVDAEEGAGGDTDVEDVEADARAGAAAAAAARHGASGDGDMSGVLVPIIAREVSIGRAQVGNHIVIDDDRAVSGYHAMLQARRRYDHSVVPAALLTEVRILDIGSRNGTFVNGRRLQLGQRHAVVLSDGDCIQLGRTRLRFVALA